MMSDRGKRFTRKLPQGICRNARVETSGIYFTSGGSESNFWAFKPSIFEEKNWKSHYFRDGEHGSIRSTLEALSQQNYEVTLLPLNQHGQMDVEKLKRQHGRIRYWL